MKKGFNFSKAEVKRQFFCFFSAFSPFEALNDAINTFRPGHTDQDATLCKAEIVL
jgi:hypothetical protein